MGLRKILPLLAVAGGVLALVVGVPKFLRPMLGTPPDGGSVATAGPLEPAAVAALGRVEPQSEIINLGAGASPDRLASLLVARGDLVHKDQVLGYLGGHAEQVAEREMYRAQLEEAKVKLTTEIELDQSRVLDAEIKLKQVQDLQPLRITGQETTVASLQAALANDKEILEAQLALSVKGDTTLRLRDNQKTQVLRDESDLGFARARLDELKRQLELDTSAAETQVRVAQASLERAKADIPIVSLSRQIDLADARAEKLTLVAPVDGRILNIMIKPGEQVGTSPILTMGDTSKMRVVAEVYETDVTRVRIGQRATISSRALVKPVGGTVVRVGKMVFKNDVLNVDPAARADARVVEVWIELDDAAPIEELTNLTVDVVISASEPAMPQSAADRPVTP